MALVKSPVVGVAAPQGGGNGEGHDEITCSYYDIRDKSSRLSW